MEIQQGASAWSGHLENQGLGNAEPGSGATLRVVPRGPLTSHGSTHEREDHFRRLLGPEPL